MKACHVVIFGCGRSGTSIFGELFEYIPGYRYLSEPPFAELLQLKYDGPSLPSLQGSVANSVAIKVPKESEGYPASAGLSFPLAELLTALPKPRKFYWQVRHPLDAIASLRIGISKNWGHHPRPPDWQDWLDKPLIVQCAYHWVYINKIGYQAVKSLVDVCKFETMLADPNAFAQRICQDIDVDPNACMQHLQIWSDRVQNTNNEKFVEAKTSRPYSRPDHRNRVGRWKENLSHGDLQQIMAEVSDITEVAEQFGYTLPRL